MPEDLTGQIWRSSGIRHLFNTVGGVFFRLKAKR